MIHIIDLKAHGADNIIAAFLVETSEGPVLVETGAHATYDNLAAGIRAAGYQVKDVMHVLLTHIHLDHAGAAWAFARHGARIYVHEVGLPHLADPSRLMHSARRIYKDMMDVLWGAMQPIDRELLIAPQDGQEISIGNTTFTALYTPGHATHHFAWQMDDVIFTGDVAGVKILGGPVMPPCPPPDIHVEKWVDSMNRLRALKPKRLYLTHFGAVDDVGPHFDGLEKCLHDWAGWVKSGLDAGKEPADMIPDFMNYVSGQLQAAGVSQKAIGQYETANASRFSVYGLARYWQKKNG